MATFRAPKDVKVSTTGPDGEEMRFDFSKGSYTTSDEAEIAFLNQLAADPEHPVKTAKEE